MRLSPFCLIGLWVGLAPHSLASAATFHFTVPIEASQAVPLPDPLSSASGIASFTLHIPDGPGDASLEYSLQLFGLDLGNISGFPPNPQTPDTADDVTAIHIHNAPLGVQGPMLFGIVVPNDDPHNIVVNPAAGTVTGMFEDSVLTDERGRTSVTEALDEFFAGRVYLNVHTVANPNSDIRAQLIVNAVPEPSTVAMAILGLLGLSCALVRTPARGPAGHWGGFTGV